MSEAVNVIIVEVDQPLRESLFDYLSLTGFQVEVVGTGLDFYQCLKAQPFNVAVIDIGLPGQSGYVLAEYARKNTLMGMILITAFDSIDSRVTGYQCGSDLFLSKPVDCRELAAAITNLASRQAERHDTADPAMAAPVWALERGAGCWWHRMGARSSLQSRNFTWWNSWWTDRVRPWSGRSSCTACIRTTANTQAVPSIP